MLVEALFGRYTEREIQWWDNYFLLSNCLHLSHFLQQAFQLSWKNINILLSLSFDSLQFSDGKKANFQPKPLSQALSQRLNVPLYPPKQLSPKAGSESFLPPQLCCFLQQWLLPFISNPESHYDPSPVAALTPQTLGTVLLLSFLDFPSEPSWHS